jgi:hypothetical protein
MNDESMLGDSDFVEDVLLRANRLGICLPTVSVAVKRGREIVDREQSDIAVLECKI